MERSAVMKLVPDFIWIDLGRLGYRIISITLPEQIVQYVKDRRNGYHSRRTTRLTCYRLLILVLLHTLQIVTDLVLLHAFNISYFTVMYVYFPYNVKQSGYD